MIYINGTASISPQPTFEKKGFLKEIVEYTTNRFQCIEPDYEKFLSPNELRRLSRVLKLGWGAAKSCLDDAFVSTPGAIITGTGCGCYHETQKFIFSMYENDETLLSPTPFIQSSHGSIAAQIAMMTGCSDYNMTYAHRGFSFESALMDALMLMGEKHLKSVLVGGVDEIGERQFITFNRIGYWKTKAINNLKLLESDSAGTIAGEGSSFFLLQDFSGPETYARIRAVHVFSNLSGTVDVENEIRKFVKRQEITVNDIDWVFLGLNGDKQFDPLYYHLMSTVFKNNGLACYKHLCGEYHTSTAFALWLAAKILKEQTFPSILKLNNPENKTVGNILIYNHYRNINHSLILVSAR
ncbi:MAG: hypothetical protein GXO86_01110 [Chlorobi bacterium]|nr:hypothetical protein [Chlorobiota bacterium]